MRDMLQGHWDIHIGGILIWGVGSDLHRVIARYEAVDQEISGKLIDKYSQGIGCIPGRSEISPGCRNNRLVYWFGAR